jgi:hypothetical protein
VIRQGEAIRQEEAEKQSLADFMQALAQCADELAATRLAADDYDQDSEDTKEEGETGDEEQEAEEKDGEGKGPAPPAGENGGGGCACSFSSPPDDRAPAKRERKMSDEGKRFRSLGQDGMDAHSSGEEGGEEEGRVIIASFGQSYQQRKERERR